MSEKPKAKSVSIYSLGGFPIAFDAIDNEGNYLFFIISTKYKLVDLE